MYCDRLEISVVLYNFVLLCSYLFFICIHILLLWQLFVMVAHNVKEDLWKGQQSGESKETTTVHIQNFAVCKV